MFERLVYVVERVGLIDNVTDLVLIQECINAIKRRTWRQGDATYRGLAEQRNRPEAVVGRWRAKWSKLAFTYLAPRLIVKTGRLRFNSNLPVIQSATPMPYPSDFSLDISTIANIEAVPLILNMVKHITGMRFAAIARVTETKWVACAVDDSIDFGLLPGSELVLETTICHEIRQHRQPVLFKYASEHPVYSTHHTPQTYGLESYVSIPITRTNGDFFGTLCAIDEVPAHFDEDAVCNTLTLFAQLIAVQLDVVAELETKAIELADATEMGILREQFIAVLGHDLRSPLSAIRMSADLLEAKLPAGREQMLATAIRQSSQRMNHLIEDVLDFSRGKLGEVFRSSGRWWTTWVTSLLPSSMKS